jgi:hypothetical protein
MDVVGVRLLRGANYNSDHYLLVAKARETLAVNKKNTQISYGEVKFQNVKQSRG